MAQAYNKDDSETLDPEKAARHLKAWLTHIDEMSKRKTPGGTRPRSSSGLTTERSDGERPTHVRDQGLSGEEQRGRPVEDPSLRGGFFPSRMPGRRYHRRYHAPSERRVSGSFLLRIRGSFPLVERGSLSLVQGRGSQKAQFRLHRRQPFSPRQARRGMAYVDVKRDRLPHERNDHWVFQRRRVFNSFPDPAANLQDAPWSLAI